MKSSQAAVDMIVFFEVSSKADYQRLYEEPTWPGAASGVTIGIGYDCGYASANQIMADWGPVLPDEMVKQLAKTTGIRGSAASVYAHTLKASVRVPWEAAMAVFSNRDIPKWENIVTNSLPHTDQLSPNSFGALVSLAYNRGPSFSSVGNRYSEMREIHNHMASQSFWAIPAEIRSMKRLWPTLRGLQIRRDREADLFQRGLL